ncbi:hypothetical protein TWF102_010635 [Orbilia oligospora]|uniref:Uncharacterized protein n=1 Tax=Orbilia oligospora TaxID=2813651 RepID=A0A7C8MZ84_ORBOL|nr:hypothetical protein TWF102_010635 [Orbilia oligospora]KAF3100497.1 hypothetical protein TWF103_008220 [Orbilia oligospora]KAF3110941.1 hypothetical protein TWF706_000401 [Orbilia oligospora]
MASQKPDEALRHHPHGTNDSNFYTHPIEVVPDPLGGPPTVYRQRPLTLSWDKMCPAARNMFAELATGDYPNRYESCVHLTLLKWAEQMSPGDPNLLPDGNPTYIQDDIIPVIKAYANRIPEPGLAGTPIPPALPMNELEALDFLHHHQALPYQQADYAEIFPELPDGFVWHPIQTLVGVRGLDHRTLIEFRAYKHFWTIHKDDSDITEFTTKDEPTSEISIVRPAGDPDYPQVVPGGFHNMSLPPTDQQIKKNFLKINKLRKYNGESGHPQLMYVRFAHNLATIITDHSNDATIFDGEGIPRPRIIGSLQYDEYIDEDDFTSRFGEYRRVYLNRLPTLFETSGPPAAPATPTTETAQQTSTPTPASAATPVTNSNTQPKTRPNVIEFTAEFGGRGLEARIDIPSCECPAAVKAAQMTGAFASGIASMKKPAAGETQHVHIPEVACCSKATAKTSTATPTTAITTINAPFKPQLDLASLSAIETKIRQLSLEKKNPRQLKPLSKNLGNAYSFDHTGAAAKAVASKIATAVSAKAIADAKEVTTQHNTKGDGVTKPSTPAAPIPTIVQTPTVQNMLPELRSMASAQGYYFANCLNRQKLVEDLAKEELCNDIPRIGPGAKSWHTLKSEQRANPITFRGMDGPSIEHIKYTAVTSIQQTVFYYLYTGERIKRKRIAADSADGTCFVKVYNILEAGQRLVVEHDIENYYVRTNGVAHHYDHSMNSGIIPTPKETLKEKIELTTEEQAAFRHLVEDSKELWKHPTTCKCRRSKS